MLHETQRTSAPSAFERLDQHRGLDRHVQRAGDARALQRLLRAVFLARRHQAGHFGFGERDFLAAEFGEADVLDDVIGGGLLAAVFDATFMAILGVGEGKRPGPDGATNSAVPIAGPNGGRNEDIKISLYELD